ncbi:50S ribosomal protein L13 [Dissostichus eleginoides]|uniref:50S ribosomal protein L13 n=1 Tax=Dissostichus eleginoides TaxID=100907 RepID=A0AAD9F894_DISEL|nr:50S ribosomal protein L13 [Dissostichus eleginoides]
MSTQKTFKEQALALVYTISGMSNPFLDDTPDLLMLDTWNIIDESAVNTVCTVESVGRDQYNKYHVTVIRDRTHSIHEPIKKNSLPLLDAQHPGPRQSRQGRSQC